MDELKSIVNLLEKEVNDINKKLHTLVDEADDLFKKIDALIAGDNKFSIKVDLEPASTLRSNMKKITPITEYRNFILSYLESCLLVRNDMIINNKPILKYSYLFLLTHFFELVLKKFIVQRNISFSDITAKSFSTHDIVKIISQNKANFIKLGLDEKLYEQLLKGLQDLCLYSNQPNDLPQSFKYPLQKDFKTPNITNNLISIVDISELKKLVESHMDMLMIGLIIYSLSDKENLIELTGMVSKAMENLNTTISELELRK